MRIKKFILLVIGFKLCMVLGVSSATAASKQYGRFVFEEYEVPALTVSKFKDFRQSEPIKGESAISNALMARAVEWSGPTFKADPSRSPYVIEIEVLGTAKENGDVSTMWQAGWNAYDNIRGEQGNTQVVPGIAKSGVKAGETLVLSGASGPVSFKQTKDANIVVGFVNARNVDIHSVKARVWVGMTGPSWTDTVMAFRWLMVPVFILGLIWWFRQT